MPVRNLKASELRGKHIYQIKNRTIYSDFFMKDYGYHITNYDAEAYYSYSLRGFESVFGFVLLLLVSKSNYILSLIVALGAYIVLSLLFYFKFLRNLEQIRPFDKPKRDGYIVDSAKGMSYKRLLALAIICILFGICSIYYPIANGYEGLFKNLMFALGGLGFVGGLIHIVSLIYKAVKKV